MELRRERSKLACKRRESTDLFKDEPIPSSASSRPISTPVRTSNPSEDEESPYFPCSTQEMNEDVDVLWDWNSPHSKPKNTVKRKSRKKLNLQNSPKVPLRRHPSNNNEELKQVFNKLQEELRALKAEIAKPDNEESLILSPREEEVFKSDTHLDNFQEFDRNVIEEHPLEMYEDDFQDPFDDDMDEKLILFSQQIEHNINKPETKIEGKKLDQRVSGSFISNTAKLASIIQSSSKQLKDKNQFNLHTMQKTTVSHCDKRQTIKKIDHLGLELKTTNEPNNCSMVMIQKYNSKFPSNVKNEQVTNIQDLEVFNDSFDNVLSQMNDQDLDQLTQVVDIKQCKNGNNIYNLDKKSKVFPRSVSEDFGAVETMQMTSRKVEWHRTQSFESYDDQLSREKLQEIEKKRLEAKAKRDARKKQEIVSTYTETSDSPIKCSPDVIEKKRLQALEKLEAKRLQDIIERKKQEALKRREESRKKKAANVKSSLSKRL